MCNGAHNMKPPDSDGQLYMPIPQRLTRTFPSTKGEACLLVFQGRCLPSSWKQLHNSLVLIWAEQSQETPNTAKLDRYTQRHVCQQTKDVPGWFTAQARVTLKCTWAQSVMNEKVWMAQSHLKSAKLLVCVYVCVCMCMCVYVCTCGF